MSATEPEVEITYEFPTSGHVGRCRLMSSNAGSESGRSGMVENVGVAVGIASPSLSVQKLFLLPVYSPPF